MFSDPSLQLNVPKNPLESLRDHPDFQFHLTGSRYFGKAVPQSDWDFFVTYDPAVVEFLTSVGFKRHNTTTYYDSQCKYVYRIFTPGFCVDVQLVENADVKLLAQRLIVESKFDLYGFRDNHTTSGSVDFQRKAAWDCFIAAAKAILKEQKLTPAYNNIFNIREQARQEHNSFFPIRIALPKLDKEMIIESAADFPKTYGLPCTLLEVGVDLSRWVSTGKCNDELLLKSLNKVM